MLKRMLEGSETQMLTGMLGGMLAESGMQRVVLVESKALVGSQMGRRVSGRIRDISLMLEGLLLAAVVSGTLAGAMQGSASLKMGEYAVRSSLGDLTAFCTISEGTMGLQ